MTTLQITSHQDRCDDTGYNSRRRLSLYIHTRRGSRHVHPAVLRCGNLRQRRLNRFLLRKVCLPATERRAAVPLLCCVCFYVYTSLLLVVPLSSVERQKESYHSEQKKGSGREQKRSVVAESSFRPVLSQSEQQKREPHSRP